MKLLCDLILAVISVTLFMVFFVPTFIALATFEKLNLLPNKP